jgi:hypothetical protein
MQGSVKIYLQTVHVIDLLQQGAAATGPAAEVAWEAAGGKNGKAEGFSSLGFFVFFVFDDGAAVLLDPSLTTLLKNGLATASKSSLAASSIMRGFAGGFAGGQHRASSAERVPSMSDSNIFQPVPFLRQRERKSFSFSCPGQPSLLQLSFFAQTLQNDIMQLSHLSLSTYARAERTVGAKKWSIMKGDTCGRAEMWANVHMASWLPSRTRQEKRMIKSNNMGLCRQLGLVSIR